METQERTDDHSGKEGHSQLAVMVKRNTEFCRLIRYKQDGRNNTLPPRWINFWYANRSQRSFLPSFL